MKELTAYFRHKSIIPTYTKPQMKIACPVPAVPIGSKAPHADARTRTPAPSTSESLLRSLMSTFESHRKPVDSVSVSNPTRNLDNYLMLSLRIFPAGQDHFNRTGISRIGFIFSNLQFGPPHEFGTYYFYADGYPYFAGVNEEGSTRLSNLWVIIGAVIGASILLLVLLVTGVYAIRLKRRTKTATEKSGAFSSWGSISNTGAVPQLRGAKSFSFEEIKKCTSNFSEIIKLDWVAMARAGWSSKMRSSFYRGFITKTLSI